VEGSLDSRHAGGIGLEQGPPSFGPFWRARRRLLKNVCRSQVATVDAVVCGGATLGSRFCPPRPCYRCGHPHEDAEHRYFACPANEEPELNRASPAIAKANWIKAKLSSWAQHECLWARGILPFDIGLGLARVKRDVHEQAQIGSLVESLGANGTLYTDGLGGPAWSSVELRRAGSGAAALQASGSFVAGDFLFTSAGL